MMKGDVVQNEPFNISSCASSSILMSLLDEVSCCVFSFLLMPPICEVFFLLEVFLLLEDLIIRITTTQIRKHEQHIQCYVSLILSTSHQEYS